MKLTIFGLAPSGFIAYSFRVGLQRSLYNLHGSLIPLAYILFRFKLPIFMENCKDLSL